MNDPLVSVWIITSKEGEISSAHCLGCKAGLGETCSHVASVLFILSPTGWLDCAIIQQAQVLLKEVNPLIEGFQRTTLGPVSNFNVMSGEFIQILHTGAQHWVCISTIGCSTGYVNLYDSMFHEVIGVEVEEQVTSLLHDSYLGINNVSVQQQQNGSDCGIFAISFATCLVYFESPENVTFDIPKMRKHLAQCLRNRKM